MRYTVLWRKVTENTLMDLWSDSSDRAAITEAVKEIDGLLQADPDSRGEDFYGDRLLIVPPLSVIFQVKTDDRIVEVIDIWNA